MEMESEKADSLKRKPSAADLRASHDLAEDFIATIMRHLRQGQGDTRQAAVSVEAKCRILKMPKIGNPLS
jgi:hypothetical protein